MKNHISFLYGYRRIISLCRAASAQGKWGCRITFKPALARGSAIRTIGAHNLDLNIKIISFIKDPEIRTTLSKQSAVHEPMKKKH